MLIVLGRNKKNNNGNTHMNFSGVAAPHITGNKIIEYTPATNRNVHTHSEDDTEYIDHVIKRPNTRTTMATMVVYADPTR